MDALDYEASQLGHEGDDSEVSVRDDINAEEYSSNDEGDIDGDGAISGFMLSDPIFSGEYVHDDDDDDDDDLFIETDPFLAVGDDLRYSDEERDESSIANEENIESGGELGDSAEDNADTHPSVDSEVQVWQYNPLLRAKKSIRDSRNNRTVL